MLDTIDTIVKLKGAGAAIALYDELKASKKAGFVFDETMLYYAGNELRKANESAAAISLYELNLKEYPKSIQTYESLTDLYTRTGNVKMVVRTYKELVKAAPQNAHEIWMLKQLKNKVAFP